MNPKQMAASVGQSGNIGNHAEVMSYLDQFAEDTKFLESIRPELQNNRPNCWVAVYKKQVVIAPTLKEVMQQLDNQDIPKSRAVIDFLRSEPTALVL